MLTLTPAVNEAAVPMSLEQPRRASSRSSRRSVSLLTLALLAVCAPSVDAAPSHSFDSSVTYSRSSIYNGLPPNLMGSVEMVLENRLASSSWRTVQSAVKIWREVCDLHGWPVILLTDDPERGGRLVAFLLHMAADTSLSWVSIEGYFWGMRVWQTLQHQIDPAKGVLGLTTFLKGLKVLTWVPSEPRKRVTVEELEWFLDDCDLTSLLAVQLCFLMLVCFNSFTRTECPCPKAHSGRNAYRHHVHWSVEDFDVKTVSGEQVMAVRFWVIKQDQRMERPEARTEEGDWVYISNVVDADGTPSKWSIFTWYARLQSFHGVREPSSPMFLDPDNLARAYTYGQFYRDMVKGYDRMGKPRKTPHGLRTGGYKLVVDALGENVAVAQGGWRSSAHHRYYRVEMSQVLQISRATAGLLGPTPMSSPPACDVGAIEEERELVPPEERATRAGLASAMRGGGGSAGPSASADPLPIDDTALLHPSLLPPGWSAIRHDGEHLSRTYTTYQGPNGERAASRREAWRAYEDDRDPPARSSDLVEPIPSDYEDDDHLSVAAVSELSEGDDGGGGPNALVVESVEVEDDAAAARGAASSSASRRGILLRPDGLRVCGTPGCTLPDRHAGPCSGDGVHFGAARGTRTRTPSRPAIDRR